MGIITRNDFYKQIAKQKGMQPIGGAWNSQTTLPTLLQPLGIKNIS